MSVKDKTADQLIRALIKVLRVERKRQGKKQGEFSVTVASIEALNTANPSLRTFLVWCRELGVDPDRVLAAARRALPPGPPPAKSRQDWEGSE